MERVVLLADLHGCDGPIMCLHACIVDRLTLQMALTSHV